MRSYENIDYRIRTRKFIERRMILDSCQKLFHFDNLNNYKYVGFGSLFFVDFKMFHKYLGIKDMVSIEDENNIVMQKRFKFNRPYSFIKMNFNISTNALRTIDFDKRSIVWLDYDNGLSTYMFEDIEILIDKMKSGSIFLVTLNTSINGDKTSKLLIELNKIKNTLCKKEILTELQKENIKGELNNIISCIKSIGGNSNRYKIKRQIKNSLTKFNDIINELNIKQNNINDVIKILNQIFKMLSSGSYYKEKPFRRERFVSDFKEYLPNREVLENELSEKQSHKILKELFDLRIRKQIELINLGKKEEEKIVYKQLYYFTYKDNARMMTIGGIIYKNNEKNLYECAKFNELEFIREQNENYEIEVPILTLKERHYIDNDYMFNDEVSSTITEINDYKSLLKDDRELYNELHRYLPNFVDVDEA